MSRIIFILILLMAVSCSDEIEYKYYHSEFYPAKEGDYEWEENEFFNEFPITFRLESRLDVYDYKSVYEGRFEEIDLSSVNLFIDKSVIINNDTFPANTNLLDNYGYIETIQQARSGGYVNDYYVIYFNKKNTDFSVIVGFYTFYFKARTLNNHTINDSTVVYIE